MKFNEIDMKNWKESDINTDSLWVINERDKSGAAVADFLITKTIKIDMKELI